MRPLSFLSLLLFAFSTFAAEYTSTHSFTNTSRGAHPNTITVAGSAVTINMSSLPAGTQVYRATFSQETVWFSDPWIAWKTTPLRIEASDETGVWLETLPPRHGAIDCTAAAQRAIATPGRQLVLNIVSCAGFNSGGEIRVDVWSNQPVVNSIPQVTGINARHQTGDTMVAFTENGPFLTNPSATVGGYKTALANMDATNIVRYRIYRSTSPISVTSIRTAELVDEIKPMSCWSIFFYNGTESDANPCIRLPIDNEVLAATDQGIYVRRAQSSATAYYAVSKVVNGEEDLSTWTSGNATNSVAENTGAGMVVLRTKTLDTSFQYVDNADLYYYIRWECPPYNNFPSTAWDYLIGVPPTTVSPRPVDVALHCWGGTLTGGYGWWYEAEQGALIVSTNMSPYDWWTAFHDNIGTIKPFLNIDGNGGGRVRNYTEKRIISFLNSYVKVNHTVDDNRIFVTGNSMGGSGCLMWNVRQSDVFAYSNGWVGVYIPRLSPTFKGSFEGVYGLDAWNCEYESTGVAAFDYWDTEQYILADPGQEIPFVCTSNGKNDSGIGWNQAWRTITALQTARQPHKFVWGQSGHSQRAVLPGESPSDRYIGITISKNQTVPAFTDCSQDENMGNGDPADGDAAGALNQYLLWQTSDILDESGRWEMTVYLISSSPDNSCTVDITPRRCQAFIPSVGTDCTWTNTSIQTSTQIQSGNVTSDQYGLVTLNDVTVSKGKNRIVITYSATPTAPTITSALTASGTTGQAFTYTITASGSAPITYDATSLPAWASFNSTTHQITGTPTSAGTFNVTISATNGQGSDSETLVIDIADGGSSTTVTLYPQKDAYTDQEAANQSANYGTVTLLQDGTNGNVEGYRNCLIQFDLSGISGSATVTEAKLRVYCQNEQTTKGGTYYVKGLLNSWTETGVTYLTRDGSTVWAGGNINGSGNSEVSARATLVNQSNVDGSGAANPYYTAGNWPVGDDWAGQWIEFDVLALVDDWVSASLTNNGLVVTCNSVVPDPGSLIDEFYGYMNVNWQSRENTNRPELVVTYTGGGGGDVTAPTIDVDYTVLSGTVSDETVCPTQVLVNGSIVIPVTVGGLNGTWQSGDLAISSGSPTLTITTTDASNTATVQVTFAGL